MTEFISRRIWTRGKEEKREDYALRLTLQYKQLSDIKRVRGQCYLINFGDDDIRPMWENQISIKSIKEQIRTPLGTNWDCPLCQPYDEWEGLATIEQNRRFMCKVVNPKYNDGTTDEGGVWQKCVCVMSPKSRQYLKFKEK